MQAAFVRLKAFRTADNSKEDTTTDAVILVIASEDSRVLRRLHQVTSRDDPFKGSPVLRSDAA